MIAISVLIFSTDSSIPDNVPPVGDTPEPTTATRLPSEATSVDVRAETLDAATDVRSRSCSTSLPVETPVAGTPAPDPVPGE